MEAQITPESIVKANKSDSAKTKARKKHTLDDLPVHSFQTLLADLGTIAKNQIQSTVRFHSPYPYLSSMVIALVDAFKYPEKARFNGIYCLISRH